MSSAVHATHELFGGRDFPAGLPSEVPADAYYGMHTLRATQHMSITGIRLSAYPELIAALAYVKQAAALANRDLGLLDDRKAAAVVAACEEILAGRWHDQFVVDVVQDGAGMSTNMNANEVITNRALEFLGRARGDYLQLHPVDDVNLSQSTDDVYATAIRLALYSLSRQLLNALDQLQLAFAVKAEELADVTIVDHGRWQNVVPTLGQEFAGYQVMVAEDRRRLAAAGSPIREVNLGATATDIGLMAHSGYTDLVRRHLAELTNVSFRAGHDLSATTRDTGAFVQLSGVLKGIAVTLSTICTELRLLSAGPCDALDQPAAQLGSDPGSGRGSCPVIPEVVNQIAFEVMGHDVTVSAAAEAGRLRGSLFEPIIAYSLLQSLTHLRAGCQTLADQYIRGIPVNRFATQRQLAIYSRAMTDGHRPLPQPARQGSAADTLSRREREIADLVSKGHTNRYIASTLSLSTRTVETYVKRIFAKLSASSRSEVAAIIVRSEGAVNVSRPAGLPSH